MVIDLNVRRNQPQCSNFAFKVRSSKNLRSSCRSRGERCLGANGNSSYIFSTVKYTVIKKPLKCGNGVEHSAQIFLTRMFDTRLAYAQFASNIQVNYHFPLLVLYPGAVPQFLGPGERRASSPLLTVCASSRTDCAPGRPGARGEMREIHRT